MKVSFIIPVYNSRRFLERALMSVIDSIQAECREIIIVDGASTDGSLDVIRRHERFLDVVISEPDDGLYCAINKGIRRSSGDLIKIVSADDECIAGAPRVAASVLDFASGNGSNGLNICYGALEIIDERGAVLAVWTNKTTAFYMPKYFPFLHPSWYVPRDVYDRVGLYDERYRISGDLEFFLRARAAGVKFAYVGAPLARFRVGGMSSGFAGRAEGFRINARYLSYGRALLIGAMKELKAFGHLTLRRRVDMARER